MAVRSIIEIDVRDSAFQAFNAKFHQYQKAIAAMPAAWRNIAQAQNKSTKAFQELVALEVQAMGHQKMMAQVQQAAARLTRTTADSWRDMARNTKSVAGDIASATTQLLKWTSLTAVFSGVLGAGGLFGINRMAEGVASGRQSSMGLGVDYGAQKAFQNAFSRVVDPDAFLSGINASQHSVTGKVDFLSLGMTGNGSATDVGIQYLEKARALAKSSNPAFDTQTMSARRIDQHMDLQSFQRLRGMSDDEFSGLKRRASANTGGFGVNSEDQLKYQNFVTAIDEAGRKINTAFVVGIAKLIDPLTNLSAATVKVVEAFLNAKQLKPWLDEASAGLENFAKYIGTDEFSQTVKGFIKDVSDMAGSVHDFVAFIKNPLAGPPKGQDYIAQASTAARNWLSGVWENRNLPPDVARASGSSPAGLRMKPGAGNIDAGLGALALDLQKNIPGFNRVTSADDSYHKHITSAHNQGRAFDFTLSDGANYAQTKRLIEAELKRLNIKGRVINEADHPIPGRTTAPHLHVQTDKTVDVRIFNAAGSSFVTHTTMNAAGVPQ